MINWLGRHRNLLKWTLALALFSWLFYVNREHLPALAEREIRFQFAAAAFLLCGSATLLSFVRWYLLARAQSLDLSLSDAVRLGFLGQVSNYFVPGGVGGDAVKAVVVARRESSRRTVAVATVVLDRLLGVLGLFLVAAGVWLLQSESTRSGVFQTISSIFAFGSFAGIIGLFCLLHTRFLRFSGLQRLRKIRFVGPMIGDLLDGVALYQSCAGVIWIAMAMSIVSHLVMLSSFYFSALALNPAHSVPDFFAHLLFMPAAELAGMIPVVPAGVGALEGATGWFYGKAGFQVVDGFATGIGYRVNSITIAALGAVYYFWASGQLKDMPQPAPELAGDLKRAG